MSEFEVGKRYRTRDGKDEVLIESMPFEGKTIIGLYINAPGSDPRPKPTRSSWDRYGRVLGGWVSPRDLIPEAIDPAEVSLSLLDQLHANDMKLVNDRIEQEAKEIIDAIESGPRPRGLYNRLDNLEKRLDDFEKRFSPSPAPPTTLFPGGWVNVYEISRGRRRIGAMFSTKEDADRAAEGNDCRFACIRIPDFTKGEGL
jgi:hypothetical protein